MLATLAWSTTVEITHNHRGQQARRASLIRVSNTSDQNGARRIESKTRDVSQKGPLSGGQCLICQLHQNLFATVLGHSPLPAPGSAPLVKASAGPVFYPSHFDSPQQGRAPPINL